MAEVGAVYDITAVPRTTTDILPGNDAQRRDATAGPTARNKWLTASVVDDAKTVVAAIFAEAHRRDPRYRRTWIALVDGNNHQIDHIHAEAKTRELTVTILIDFVHVLEYLWKAAWSLHAEGDPAAETWVRRHAQTILAGGATRVAGALRRAPPPPAWNPAAARTPTPAPATSPARPTTSTTRTPCSRAGPSRPASSKAPADTPSKTG